MTKRSVAALIVWGLVPASVVPAEGDGQAEWDLIRLVGEAPPLHAKVSKEDYLFVEGQTERSAIKLPSYRVVDVIRVWPLEYQKGMDQLKDGRYAVAAKYFTHALRNNEHNEKPWLFEYCNYRLGDAMLDGQFWNGYKGKTYTYSPPATYYEQVLKANPRSRFLLDVSVKMAICLVEQGKYAEAEKAFTSAEIAIREYGEETARTGDVGYHCVADHAEAMLKSGRVRLLEKRDGVVPEGKDDPFSALWGTIEDSKARAESIIKKYQESRDPSLLPKALSAHVVMGRYSMVKAGEYEAKGDISKAQQAFADARRSYLEVGEQPPHIPHRQELLEEALYFAGFCCDKLKDQEPDGEKQAIGYWLNVVHIFPDGAFGKQAAKELERVGYKPPPSDEKKPAAAGQTLP